MTERHMPDVKVVRVDRGGVGRKYRKCFFHGRDHSINKYHIELHSSFKGKLFNKIMQLLNILLFRSYNCCDLQFWYITVSFFSDIEALCCH